MSPNAKTELLHSLAWAYTENDGKIKGCEYWSFEAIKKYEKIIQNEKMDIFEEFE